MTRPGDPFIRGAPLDVHFLGFHSDTFELQRAGWQISEEKSDRYRDEFRIAIRHPAHHISGMSRGVDREAIFRWYTGCYRAEGRSGPPVIEFELAVQSVVHYPLAKALPAFAPVDAQPRYEVMQERDLYDMPYFRPIGDGKEIFLREASIQEIMQIALDKQEPEQARIKASRAAEQRREEYRQGGETKAQLILVS